MRLINSFLNLGFAAMLTLSAASCGDDAFVPDPDDPFVQPGDRAATIEVPLRLHTDRPEIIGKPLVNDIVSRAGEGEGDDEETADPEKAAEEAIHDIWVFQYDSKGNQLIAPRYYETSSVVIKDINIRLAEGEDSRVYVLANTGDAHWADAKDLTTVEKFVGYEYPFTEENVEMGEDEYLLMEGHVNKTIRKEEDLLPVDIHLTRLMAKISFKYVTASAASNLKVTRVIINNMPEKMRMEETPIEEDYPLGDFETRSVTIDKKLASGEVYTFYMPANRRGVSDNTDAGLKNNGAPEKALYVQLFVSSESNGSNFLYTIYLGENDTNDYNVRRNHNYNITLNINSENRDQRVLAAPANCYVLGFNENIMFDPYNRTETGGGWKYSDYVNKNVKEKKIDHVDILWQEKGVIGDNTNGKLVYLDKYNRVNVTSGSTAGNAVIAGYNEAGEIVWSWHIWVNNDKPAQISKAVSYYTFGWDASGIKTSAGRVVKGRSLMQCNLGARSATAQDENAYGLIYQWGRKDPFFTQNSQNLSGGNVKTIVDKTNRTQIPMKGDNGTTKDTGLLFDFTLTNAQKGTIEWVLKHPTVFVGTGGSDSSDDYSAYNNGDWYWKGEDRLWGGKPFAEAKVKYLVIAKGKTENGITMAHDGWLSDNGAKEKSLFDPCPAGWMVPPHDMWLTFTKDGRNAGWGETYHGNRNVKFQTGLKGHLCYVTAWRGGSILFFPSPGWRRAYGSIGGRGSCGNYHTSTPSTNGTVNCFHIHAQDALLTFESSNHYTRRAFAGPIRCVRDVDD